MVIDCLASLETEVQCNPGLRVVIADNASGDDSVQRLGDAIERRGWDAWATLMPLPENGGFAYGNNAAIRPALAGDDPPVFVILLNPDTLVHPGAVGQLIDFFDRHPDVGIAGSRLEDPDGTPQRSAFRFHTLRSELNDALRFGPVSRLLDKQVVAPPPPVSEQPTDWVAGACMIVRRDVFDAIGLLDEGYFMYFEETDFCKRAADAGFPSWYAPKARVIHLVGQASGVTDTKRKPKRRPRYWFDSRRRYMLKQYGWAKTLLIDLTWAMGYPLYRLRHAAQGRRLSEPPHLWSDFVRYNLLCPRSKP